MNRQLTTVSIAGLLLAAMALPSSGAYAQGFSDLLRNFTGNRQPNNRQRPDNAELRQQHANQGQILQNLDTQRVQLSQQINNLQASRQISNGTASNLMNDLNNVASRESSDVRNDNLNVAEVQAMVNDMNNVQAQLQTVAATGTNYSNGYYANQGRRNNGNRNYNARNGDNNGRQVAQHAQQDQRDNRGSAANNNRSNAANDNRSNTANDSRSNAANDKRSNAANDNRSNAANDNRSNAGDNNRSNAANDKRSNAGDNNRSNADSDQRGR